MKIKFKFYIPFILFMTKIISILLIHSLKVKLHPLIYLTLVILTIFSLLFFNKLQNLSLMLSLLFVFLFFDSFPKEKSVETFKFFNGKIIQQKKSSKNQNQYLVLKNNEYKIWALLKNNKFLLNENDKINAEGFFKPILKKNYFYSEGFTHSGVIYKINYIKKTKKWINLKSHIKSFFSYSKYQHLYAGFILGERNSIDKSILNLYKANGCMHLLAISGLHVAILITFIFFILKILKIPHPYLLVFSNIILFAYLIFLNFPASATRAIVFTTLLTFTKLYEKKVSLLDILYLSAFFIFLINHKTFYSLGFQLSFMATLGILYGLPLCVKATSSIKIKWINYLLNALLIGFFAQLFIFPIIIYYFKTFNLISLFLTIPLSILLSFALYWAICGLFFNIIFSSLAKLLLNAADFMNLIMLEILRFSEKIHFFKIKMDFSTIGVIVYYLIIIIGLKLLKYKKRIDEILV